jgi:hypothetical protein
MMRKEQFVGGIFMVSNESDSCAIWNCRVHDPRGDIIGPHGNLERMRPLLGPPDLLLQAGEMVWITDKTPHESLPLRASAHRQYFRLVVGEVTAWFEEHSTANPLCELPATVRLVKGNKFALYPANLLSWTYGSSPDIRKIHQETCLRKLMAQYGLGHISNELIDYGINSIEELKLFVETFDEKDNGIRSPYYDARELFSAARSTNGKTLFEHSKGCAYYDFPQFRKLIAELYLHRGAMRAKFL